MGIPILEFPEISQGTLCTGILESGPGQKIGKGGRKKNEADCDSNQVVVVGTAGAVRIPACSEAAVPAAGGAEGPARLLRDEPRAGLRTHRRDRRARRLRQGGTPAQPLARGGAGQTERGSAQAHLCSGGQRHP